ncbi:MAG: response regulator transcription factor [Desulfovibrio sp.]|jgi:DNA-binding NarL/FixJ family response regulator|nr:response regulator transcription factor [Desulfovibrio sp.]
MPVRVLIVDDHALSRRGIVSILSENENFQVVGEAIDGEDSLEKVKSLHPDLILMDIRMPGKSGLEVTRIIKNQCPQIKIVILSVSDDAQDFFEAIKNGAQGYLLKNMDTTYWLDYLMNIAKGEVPIPRNIASKILEELSHRSYEQQQVESEILTVREKEILSHVSNGLSNKEIGESIYISESPVKNHMRNIMEKLHLRSRTQLVAFAYKSRIIRN